MSVIDHLTINPLVNPVSARLFSDYTRPLRENRATILFIAAALEKIAPSSARALRECGRRPINWDKPIEVRVFADGGCVPVNIRFCGLRFCPTCSQRNGERAGSQRAQRAATAVQLGYSVASVTIDRPRCEPGELATQLAELHQAGRVIFPPPSRWPTAPSGWIGVDWNTEVDFDLDARTWYVHRHGEAYMTSPFTPEVLTQLKGRGVQYAEPARFPEALGRYNTKARNPKLHVLGLFDLAGLGMADQVEEYVLATNERRFRATSVKLSKLLKMHEVETSAASHIDHLSKPTIHQATVTEWRRVCGD